MAAALAGKDYFTLPEMMGIINAALKNHNIVWGHLDKQWDFTSVRAGLGIEFQRLRNAHSLCFTRTASGVTVRWRQWLTDNDWSRPILLLDAVRMQQVSLQMRPPEVELAFPEAISTGINSFLAKLDILLEAGDAMGSTAQGQAASDAKGSTVPGQVGSTAHSHKRKDRMSDMAWLRRVAKSEEHSLKQHSDKSIDDIISDLVRIGQVHVPGRGDAASWACPGLEDTVVQLYPGSDVCAPEACAEQSLPVAFQVLGQSDVNKTMRPALPVDSLVKVTGCIEEQLQGQRPETCAPGTFLLVKRPKLCKLPFLLGMMTDAGR